MLLEICTPSLESVTAAVSGGAERIELCEQLEVGGVTPRLGLVEQVLQSYTINTQVLIRPRGGDFVFTAEEIRQMTNSVEAVGALGVQGVVIGALTADGNLDIPTLKTLVEAAGDLELTFHKAIDTMKDPESAIDTLISLGFIRILTSAGAKTALDGLENLKAWQARYGNEITIMPGGSIRPENINAILSSGFSAIHSAAIKKGEIHSDKNTVKALASALKDQRKG
ncbi:copper homeostasis protein CutC [Gilvibacter sp.]|uniref:copper homeostasis protein CutC n=1 Tax=Gilvibacter sp. TaxID=2729997 RepID=UPI0035BE191E